MQRSNVRDFKSNDFVSNDNLRVQALERRNRELAGYNDNQTRRIRELELALADAEARILSQAKMICSDIQEQDDGEEKLPAFLRRPVREIADEVLRDFPGVAWEDIIGVRRERRLIQPRHACMKAVYEERKDLSLPALGRIFKRDHTSVLYAVHKEMPTQ